MISLTSLMNKANTLAFKDFAACILVMSCIPQQRTGGGENASLSINAQGFPRLSPRKPLGTRGKRGGGGKEEAVCSVGVNPARIFKIYITYITGTQRVDLTCDGYICSIRRVAWQIIRVGALRAQYRIDDESTQQYIYYHVTHGGNQDGKMREIVSCEGLINCKTHSSQQPECKDKYFKKKQKKKQNNYNCKINAVSQKQIDT